VSLGLGLASVDLCGLLRPLLEEFIRKIGTDVAMNILLNEMKPWDLSGTESIGAEALLK